MDFHGIGNSLKHLVVDDVPDATTAKAAPKAAPLPTPSAFNFGAAAYTPSAAVPGYVATATALAPESDDAYSRLASKINFDSTSASAVITKYLTQLASVPETVMSQATKQTTALLQAKGEIGADKILGAFDELKARLADERQKFSTFAQAFEAKEITARQQRLTDIQAQITQLNNEMSQVSIDLAAAQGKGAQTGGAFTAAAQRLDNELDQQKAHIAASLQ